MERVDLTTLCEAVAEELEGQARARGITIRCALEPDIVLTGDQTLLTRMLINLVSNAVAYGKEQGEATIRLTREQGDIVLCVEDNGPGIPAESLERLTEAFYRVDKSRSRRQGGAGLGLTLCAKIAELHKGSLHFESQEGRGTKVTAELKGGRI